jgi:hypothetical protein
MKVIAISNNLQVNKSLQTKVIKFKDAYDVYGFQYTPNPSFYQQFRLELVFGRIAKFPLLEKVYRQQNGVFKNKNVSIDKQYTLKTGYFDESTHKGLMVGLKHSDMYIDGVQYFNQGEYEMDGDDDDTLTNLVQAKTAILQQGFSITSVSC